MQWKQYRVKILFTSRVEVKWHVLACGESTLNWQALFAFAHKTMVYAGDIYTKCS
jgi:hypothetical protein